MNKAELDLIQTDKTVSAAFDLGPIDNEGSGNYPIALGWKGLDTLMCRSCDVFDCVSFIQNHTVELVSLRPFYPGSKVIIRDFPRKRILNIDRKTLFAGL